MCSPNIISVACRVPMARLLLRQSSGKVMLKLVKEAVFAWNFGDFDTMAFRHESYELGAERAFGSSVSG